jgi:hypothetical protein
VYQSVGRPGARRRAGQGGRVTGTGVGAVALCWPLIFVELPWAPVSLSQQADTHDCPARPLQCLKHSALLTVSPVLLLPLPSASLHSAGTSSSHTRRASSCTGSTRAATQTRCTRWGPCFELPAVATVASRYRVPLQRSCSSSPCRILYFLCSTALQLLTPLFVQFPAGPEA